MSHTSLLRTGATSSLSVRAASAGNTIAAPTCYADLAAHRRSYGLGTAPGWRKSLRALLESQLGQWLLTGRHAWSDENFVVLRRYTGAPLRTRVDRQFGCGCCSHDAICCLSHVVVSNLTPPPLVMRRW